MVEKEHRKYVTTTQAAEILGKTGRQVRDMIARGELSADKSIGWYILERAEVEAKAQES